MCNGHPTGMWESSRSPLPFCSIIVPSMGTSIVALRLTCARLHFHASGASKPRETSSASAGNSGCSFSGSASSVMTSLRPCSGWAVLGPFEVQLLWHCEVFEPGGADRLDTYFTGGTRVLDAFPTQAMVDRRDHPCGDKHSDKLHVPDDLWVLRLNFWILHLIWPSMTRVFDSDRSKDAVTFKPRYNSRDQYSLRNIRKDKVPHFQYVFGWYQEGDQPFSQEFNHSCLKLWEDFLDRLERCFDVWDVYCRGTPTVRLAYSSAK